MKSERPYQGHDIVVQLNLNFQEMNAEPFS